MNRNDTTCTLGRAVCATLGLVLALALAACRTAPLSVAAAGPTTEQYDLSPGLTGLVWAWDTPDGEVPWGLPEDSKAEFGRRFARFCADTGIAQTGEMQFEVQRAGFGAWVRVSAPEAVHKRLRDLNFALDGQRALNEVNVDLLLLEVPETLARKWGLDGLPAADTPPAPFAEGVPAVLEPAAFTTLKGMLLAQRGVRIFGAANVTTLSGTSATCRQADQVALLESVKLNMPAPTPSVSAPVAAASEASAPPTPAPVPVVSRDYGDPRDIGLVFEVLPSVSVEDNGVDLEVKITVDSLDGWVTYNRKETIRVPVLSSMSLETHLACTLGRTLIAGKVFRSGEETTGLTGQPPRRSCILAFVTPRLLAGAPVWPQPDAYVNGDRRLVVIAANLAGIKGSRPRQSEEHGSADEGDDDDDDQRELPGPTSREVREYAAPVGSGISFDQGQKLFYHDARIVEFGPEAWTQQLAAPFATLDGWDASGLVECRAAAARVSPALWLELTQGEADTPRTLTVEQMRLLLARIEADPGSELLLTGALTAPSGCTAVLRSAVEVRPPDSYDEHLVGDRSIWLPVLAREPRDVGVVLEVLPTLASGNLHVDLEVRHSFTEFMEWQPCGPTLGMPVIRTSMVESKIILPHGTYALLGGGGASLTGKAEGGGSSDDRRILWILGVDRVLPQ